MSASLSTHVLDTASGSPAAGVAVELLRGDEVVRDGTLVSADEAQIAQAHRAQARTFTG